MLTGSFRLLLDGLAALTYVAAGLSREHNGYSHLTHPVTGAVGSQTPAYSICVIL